MPPYNIFGALFHELERFLEEIYAVGKQKIRACLQKKADFHATVSSSSTENLAA
jgi:hypothetical protein